MNSPINKANERTIDNQDIEQVDSQTPQTKYQQNIKVGWIGNLVQMQQLKKALDEQREYESHNEGDGGEHAQHLNSHPTKGVLHRGLVRNLLDNNQ